MFLLGNSNSNNALVIFRVEQPERALEILKNEDVHVKSPEELYG